MGHGRMTYFIITLLKTWNIAGYTCILPIMWVYYKKLGAIITKLREVTENNAWWIVDIIYARMVEYTLKGITALKET